MKLQTYNRTKNHLHNSILSSQNHLGDPSPLAELQTKIQAKAFGESITSGKKKENKAIKYIRKASV